MPKYYEGEAIVKAFTETTNQSETWAKGVLASMKEADVAPVVHARWIPKKEMIRSPEAKNYNCSACGKESFAYPNCPYCRSIMDEEVKEDGKTHL